MTGGVLSNNPFAPVGGPRVFMENGKTPVLSKNEINLLLDSIPERTPISVRDKTLLLIMYETFARVGWGCY